MVDKELTFRDELEAAIITSDNLSGALLQARSIDHSYPPEQDSLVSILIRSQAWVKNNLQTLINSLPPEED